MGSGILVNIRFASVFSAMMPHLVDSIHFNVGLPFGVGTTQVSVLMCIVGLEL